MGELNKKHFTRLAKMAHGVVAEQRDEDAGSRSASIVGGETIMADGRPG
jgi:hypothetical protein